MDWIRGQPTGPGYITTGSRLAFAAGLALLLATCATAPGGVGPVHGVPEAGPVATDRWSALDVDVSVPQDAEADEAPARAATAERREAGRDEVARDETVGSPDEPSLTPAGDEPGPDAATTPETGGEHPSGSTGVSEPDRRAGGVVDDVPDPAGVVPARPTRVVVPRIGVDNPVVPVGLHADKSLEVPDEAHVAGWYAGFSRPGETGRPAVVAGHNVWGGNIGVFYRLHQLEPGDVIELRGEDESVVRFEVERIEQHPKDDFPTNRVYDPTDRAELRVITCGGRFDQSRGSHVDNVIAFAVRVT